MIRYWFVTIIIKMPDICNLIHQNRVHVLMFFIFTVRKIFAARKIKAGKK